MITLARAFDTVCSLTIDPDKSSHSIQLLVSVNVDCAPCNAEDLQLLRAYRSYGIAMEGNVPELNMEGFSIVDALRALLGPHLGSEELIAHFDQLSELEPFNEDGLVWLEFNKGYDKDVVNDFGYTQTRHFKQYLRDEKVRNNQQPSEDSGSEEPMGSTKEVVLQELSHKHELEPYRMKEIQEAMPLPSLLLLPC
jgi:hypothetical protein